MFARLRSYLPILLLTLGHGLVDSYGGMLQVLAPGMAEHLGVPLGDLVILMGVSALVNNMIQPTAAWVMGNRNLAWVLWVAVLLACLAAFMGHASNFAVLCVLVTLGAAGTGLYHPEAVMAAHDASGDRAHLGIPLFMGGGAAVYAALTPLFIRVSETYGFRSLAWFAVPGVLVAAVFLILYRKRRREHPSIVFRPRSKRITVVREGTGSYWPLLAVGVCICMATGLFLAVLSSHFELRFGAEARHWSGWVLMVWGVGATISSFLWGTVAKRHGFYRLALWTQVAAFPLFLLMAYVSSPMIGFAVAVPLCVVSPASIHPAAVTLAKNTAGATQALRTSLMMGGTFGLASVAVMGAGWLIRHGVPSSSILVFIGCCSLAAAAISLWQVLVHRVKL